MNPKKNFYTTCVQELLNNHSKKVVLLKQQLLNLTLKIFNFTANLKMEWTQYLILKTLKMKDNKLKYKWKK